MPRPARVSVDDIFEVLKTSIIYELDGTLKTRNDDAWRKASRKLDRKITPNTLRFYVHKNWRGLRQRLKLYYNERSKYGFEANCVRLIDRCLQMKFDMSVPKEKWELIKPVVDEQGKKKMARGWGRHLTEVIMEKTGLPCVFTNMKGMTYKTNNDFKFSGSCTECGNPIEGKYFFMYGMHGFEIVTRNTKALEHKVKLQMIPIVQKDPKPQKTKQTEDKREIPQSSQNNNPNLRAPYNPPRTSSRLLAKKTQSVQQVEEMADIQEIQSESQSEDQQQMEQGDTASPKTQNETEIVQSNESGQVQETQTTVVMQELQCQKLNETEQVCVSNIARKKETPRSSQNINPYLRPPYNPPKTRSRYIAKGTQSVQEMKEMADVQEIHSESQSVDQQPMEQADEITATPEIQDEVLSVQSNGLDQIEEIQTTLEIQEEEHCQNSDGAEQVHVIHVTHETQPLVQFEEQIEVAQTRDMPILHESHDGIQFQVPQQTEHTDITSNTPVIHILIPAQATNISTLG